MRLREMLLNDGQLDLTEEQARRVTFLVHQWLYDKAVERDRRGGKGNTIRDLMNEARAEYSVIPM